ncbi:SRPBCC family protein [Actinospongicola halichondriae]|uniref:SRPBCC family protein n=1 Tax=Actinospongicola halichondriae TaxID=3236844 RepID=UPI003D55B3C2
MADQLTASASATVDAPADEVFAFICRPANHPEISGDDSVKGDRHGPEQLTGEGDKFGMRMKMFGLPYRITNTVVEFEAGKKIAWCHPGKHRWRWEVEALPSGGTKVTETFDMSTSPMKPALRLMGYPKGHQGNVEKSVANVASHFAS